MYEALGSPATLGERKSAASFREVMRLLEEAATGPSWNAVALRSALVAMTVERDDLRAAHERLDRDARAVAGRSLRKTEARAEKAEAAIERVRSWCDDYDNHQAACAYWQPFPTGTVPVCDCSVRDLRAALDEEA